MFNLSLKAPISCFGHALEVFFNYISGVFSKRANPKIGLSVIKRVSIYMVNAKSVRTAHYKAMKVNLFSFKYSRSINFFRVLCVNKLSIPPQKIVVFQALKVLEINKCFHAFRNFKHKVIHAMELSQYGH